MKTKKLIAGAALSALAVFTLSSCSSTNHNTTTPYGSLYSSLSSTVASANNGEFTLDLKTYYNSLRKNGNTLVTQNIQKAFYHNEYDALTLVLDHETYNELTSDEKELVNNAYLLKKDDNSEPLFTLTEETNYKLKDGTLATRTMYEELREELLQALNKSIASSILSKTTCEAINDLTDDEFDDAIAKYVDTVKLIGIDVTEQEIKTNLTTDVTASSYYLDDSSDIPCFSLALVKKLTNEIEDDLVTKAADLSAKKALYKIADEEYITDDENSTKKKNTNYIYKDSNIESKYDSTYKTYGSYKFLVIQFNSRREADLAISAVTGGNGISSDPEEALEQYVDLYKKYYSYKTDSTFSVDEFKASTEQPFYYQVNEYDDELDDVSSSVKSLIKDDLEDGDYLTEARNLSNKYVLAYRYETIYDYHEADGDQLEWGSTEMTEEIQAELTKKIKKDLVDSNASSYRATNFNNLLDDANDNDDLKIYDPYFEYSFKQTYSDYYDYISDSVSNTDSNIFTLEIDGETISYTVEDFYKDTALKYQDTIITNYFELEYAYQYYDEFVDESYISDDLHDDNADSLSDAIKNFNKNKNSSYPSWLGEETYLLLAYGYTNYDDVLKYYYDAKKALTVYNSMVVFTEWQNSTANEDGTYSISESASEAGSILDNILNTGNANYSDIFTINIDHILINIDDDGDGSPDDPDEFLEEKDDEFVTKFENAVVELAKALYNEAVYINENYDIATYKEVLSTIKTRFNQGLVLLSDTTKTWDDYRSEFPFLLTVESLGDITQETSSNYVTSFKEYIENAFKYVSNASDVEAEYEYGAFIFVDTTTFDNDDVTGYYTGYDDDDVFVSTMDADKITMDTLCKTNYGYHMIVMNSYSKAASTKYTESDDTLNIQSALEIILRSYTDNDDNSQKVTVVTDSYNSYTNQASFTQLFIFLVQKLNSQSSTLDSDKYSIISTLFDTIIDTYNSDNFKNFRLLSKLNSLDEGGIVIDFEIAGVKLTSNLFELKIKALAGLITSYDEDSDYLPWVDGTYTWVRPDGR